MSDSIIQISEVNKWYGDFQVLKDINLEVKAKEKIVVCGPSGSGKSTLISLLQNLYPIQKGGITIGNLDLKYIQHESLRNLVSVVPQKIDLFAGNVIDNIAKAKSIGPNVQFL